jgi:hypothetical protein
MKTIVSTNRPKGRPKSGRTIYDSAMQASAITGIPRKHFKIANEMGAPGIEHNRIMWDVFGPWYEKNKKDIEAGLITDEDTLKSYKLIRDLIDYDLDIQRKRKEALTPEDVYSFLNKIGLAQSSLIKSWKKDLPSKFSGKGEIECSVVLEDAINGLLGMYQKELTKWIPLK